MEMEAWSKDCEAERQKDPGFLNDSEAVVPALPISGLP